jgi:hypothetical protein
MMAHRAIIFLSTILTVTQVSPNCKEYRKAHFGFVASKLTSPRVVFFVSSFHGLLKSGFRRLQKGVTCYRFRRILNIQRATNSQECVKL